MVIGVHIEKEYENLVNASTRFWNVSGITLTGGLTGGIQVKSESLQTLMAGGIAFETPQAKAPLQKRIPRFRLFANHDDANQKGSVVTIKVDRADGLRSGTPVRFKGLDVGKIESVDLTDDLQSVILTARITEVPEKIARVGSQFWVVKPELGLIKTANLETLVTGQVHRSATGGEEPRPAEELRCTGQCAGSDQARGGSESGIERCSSWFAETGCASDLP